MALSRVSLGAKLGDECPAPWVRRGRDLLGRRDEPVHGCDLARLRAHRWLPGTVAGTALNLTGVAAKPYPAAEDLAQVRKGSFTLLSSENPAPRLPLYLAKLTPRLCPTADELARATEVLIVREPAR